MQNGHGVSYVGTDELPADVEWTFVETDADELILCIREDAVCPRVLEEAWAAFRQIRPVVPKQRRPLAMKAILGAGLLTASCAEGASFLPFFGTTWAA